MGIYISKNSHGKVLRDHDKVSDLHEDGAHLLTLEEVKVLEYEPDVLICIVDNGSFQAAAFIYDKKEFQTFYTYKEKYIDGRPYYWMRHPKAKELSELSEL